MRGLAASLLVAALGAATLWWATDGLRAFTSEGARRLAVREHPRPVPDLLLEDAAGERFRLSDLRGHPIVIDFIYTRCPTVCVAAGGALERLTRDIEAYPGSATAPVLLSVSFDPRDTPTRLADYARRFHADGSRWRIVRPVHRQGLKALLETFGVVVIPDGLGGFQHNAALHIVDRHGRLRRIRDLDDPERTLRVLQELSNARAPA